MKWRKRKLIAEINVVPYIDVMLVLLVIFMVTAPLLSQGYQVNLPGTSARPLNIERQTQIVVSITDKNEYYYSQGTINKKLSVAEIQKTIKQLLEKGREPAIFIKGDRRVEYGEVVNLMAALQETGVESVGLLTQPLPTNTR